MEKYVTVTDGWGASRRIPESKIPYVQKQAKELRIFMESQGMKEEEMKKYDITIAKDEK